MHEKPIGATGVHLTPRWILDGLGPFDLDPCASDPRPWDCAATNYTEFENGLLLPWHGRVWLNPPFDRRSIGLWIGRMALHGHGTALVHARTDTKWFQHIWDEATALFFFAGRIAFLRPTGEPTRTAKGVVTDSGAPVVLAAFGPADADAVAFSGFDGRFVPLRLPIVVPVTVSPTWAQVVCDWLRAERRPVSLAEIYEAFSRHPKARKNPNWQAKIRQVLQQSRARRVDRGTWEMASQDTFPEICG
jgi:hypothetical protein